MARDNSSFYDYLIIGQGLAGSLLAWNLLQKNQSVLVVDNKHAFSSTMVAAGLVNPMAGMRFNLPTRIDEWLNVANHVYNLFEQDCGRTLHHSIPMVRLFRSNEQIRFWQRQVDSGRASAYMGNRFAPNESDQPVHAPFGGFLQKRTGYVDLPALMNHLTATLKETHQLVQEVLGYDDIKVLPGEIKWKNLKARHCIFCEGYRGQENPWFEQLPFTPDKGEFLTVNGGTQPDKIINGAHMAVPLAQGGFRFGATHEHSVQNNEPTEEGLSELLDGMRRLLKSTEGMEVTAHHAGVRPATRDRQPFLGTHPRYPNLHIFNGFGARGTLTIPWHAQQFSDYLLTGKPLPEEADISRFK